MDTDTTVEATFCFIDIAGYTALTDTHGEAAAADLMDDFSQLIRAVVEPLGHLQSLEGDCAFFVFSDPLVALAALVALYRSVAERQNFPVVRAGLHHGPALRRGGRYFGSTVNTAARVAAQATGGQILCTKQVADVLERTPNPDFALSFQGESTLRNLPVAVGVYEIALTGAAHSHVIDPVCKMQVDPRQAAGQLRVDGRSFWFCSLACAERFAGHPASYT